MPRTAVHVIRHSAALYGDATWLRAEDKCYSFKEMDRASTGLAWGLKAAQLGAGEAVLVMLPNTVDFIVGWLAIAKLRAVQVPVNTAYQGAMLSHVINDSGARTIIIDARYLEALSGVKDRLATLKNVIVRGRPEHVPPSLFGEFSITYLSDLHTDRTDSPGDEPQPWDIAAIMYTSGTTGPSKGVLVTHAHAYQYAAADNALQLAPGDIYYAPLPFFHIAGQWAVVYNCLTRGATAVITEKFSISSFWDDVQRFGATTTFMLGAMGSFLFRKTPQRMRTTLSKVLMSPLIPEYQEFRERFGVRLCTSYASTEVNGCIATDFDPPNHLTCGRVRADKFEVRLVDEHDREVPCGVVGELVVRPREPWLCMAGYLNRPEESVKAWRNLWLHSGDLMKQDENGYFYFVDRAKDSIRRRGENISSIEVEKEINGHPAVFESAVVPVPSEYTEQEVMAFVVLKAQVSVSASDLVDYLVPRMPRFMVPRYIEFIAELPRTPTGKIQKFQLRERGTGSDTWDMNPGSHERDEKVAQPEGGMHT